LRGSLVEETRLCVERLGWRARVYPMIPSCTFLVRPEAFRHCLDRSLAENDVTLLAYGLCHPDLSTMVSEYGDRVARLEGGNCYHLFLGDARYRTYHAQGIWMLNKPFFTKWKEGLLAGFGAGTCAGRHLFGSTFSKLAYLKLSHDGLDAAAVDDFATAAGLEWESCDADLGPLESLLRRAYEQADRAGGAATSEPPPVDLGALLAGISEIIYTFDANTKEATYVSPRVEQIFGFTPGHFRDVLNGTAQSIIEDESVRANVGRRRYEFFLRCLKGGELEPFEALYRARDRAGRAKWIRESLGPQYAPDGTISAFVGRMEDVTEKEDLRERMMAGERMAAVGTLAATLAHQINSPLQAITVLLGTIRNTRSGDAELMGQMAVLRTAFLSIRDTTRSLMALGQPPSEPSRLVSVSREAEEAVILTTALAASLGITMTQGLAPDLPLVESSVDLLQVFVNLLNNAFEAIEGAGRRTGRVGVTTSLEARSVVAVVSDDGPGIPPAELRLVFSPYYTVGKNKGMGVGLPFCLYGVQKMGGEIRASNRPEGGAAFTIRLPLRAGAA
jgi:two-component system, OmpR family, aerobic respiration control sensor histidine kinase ArcB